MGRWEKCGETRGNWQCARGWIYFLISKGGTGRGPCSGAEGSSGLGRVSCSLGLWQSLPKPAAADRTGGRGLREHKYEHFLFLLKDLEKENF